MLGPLVAFPAHLDATFKFLFNGVYYGGAKTVTLGVPRLTNGREPCFTRWMELSRQRPASRSAIAGTTHLCRKCRVNIGGT